MISIKSAYEIKLMKEAGHINYLAHQYIEPYIKPGVTTLELDELINSFVESHGGICSCYKYEGFPKHICASINDEVVHGIPSKRRLKNGDIVKLDFTVRKNGYESDMTRTYFVGEVSPEVKEFVNRVEESLYVGLKAIKAGARIGDIGYAISNYVEQYNYTVVEELVGHGIGSEMHESPDVPNTGQKHQGIRLKEGMTLAIEPMINMGQKDVSMLENDWTIVTDDGSYSAHFEHTIVVTKDGYEILTGE